jgi:aminoglycoside phosphotransferase family enzyme/predicted kinase
MLIIVSGLPGTGKTSVAKEIAQKVDSVVLSSDELRKRVLKELGYTERKKKRVYDEMFRIAQDLLERGKSVVLDGTFFQKELRDKAYRLGKKKKECVFLIQTVCPEKIVKKRIEKRYKSQKDYSEANYRVYKIIKSKFEPLRREHFLLETENKNRWMKKTLVLANKMRIIEKQEKIINRLKKKGKMRLIQTHISWVLLDDKYAYKIKKPVHFSFVNYSSLERRKHFCEEENRINSQFSPELYLGVVVIRKSEDSLSFDGRGRVVEYALKMVQLPQRERMDHLLRKGKISHKHIVDIAKIINDFHSKAEEAPQQYGMPETIRDNFRPAFKAKNIIEKHLHSGKKMDAIQSHVEAFLKKKDSLFKKRTEEKRVKHCHGDLRTKNIFIHKDEIYIFDAIEFSERIASCDVAAEIAFLAMDLRFHEKGSLADVFVRKYIKLSKDREIEKLIDFYQCYRALVETMVKTYLIVDPEIPEKKKEAAKKECQKYLALASSFSKNLKCLS